MARCAGTNPSTASRSDADSANYETTIADRINGQRSKPLRVVMFNTDTDRAEDVSHAIAQARTCRWLDVDALPAHSDHAHSLPRGRRKRPDKRDVKRRTVR